MLVTLPPLGSSQTLDIVGDLEGPFLRFPQQGVIMLTRNNDDMDQNSSLRIFKVHLQKAAGTQLRNFADKNFYPSIP